MREQVMKLLPVGATKVDDARWRVVADVSGVAMPVTYESRDEVLLVHTTIDGLPVDVIAGELLALNRILRRVRIGADQTLVTVWADLDLEQQPDARVMEATLSALVDAAAEVLAIGGRALGGPGGRVVEA